MRRTASGAAAMVLAIAAIGCGSDQLSLKDLRSQATAICQSAANRASAIRTPAAPAGTAAFLTAGAAALAPEVSKLKGLNPPSAQAAQYHGAVNAADEELALIRRARASLSGASTDPATAIAGLQSALTPVRAHGDAQWRALGIPACVSR